MTRTSEINELRKLDSHFAFGRNWRSYAETIDKVKISAAEAGLAKLIPPDEISGRSFLDIGCGSGIHALAALRLGAKSIVACDLDPESVNATKKTLNRYAKNGKWQAKQASVFELENLIPSQFDIVYSWGVLHHTGDMDAAIRTAANFVATGGLLVLALYRRTWLDGFWRIEKRWYSNASPKLQKVVQQVFGYSYKAARFVTGKGDVSERGMDLEHDVHDWLGGYPYESILASELDEMLQGLGLSKVRVFARDREIGIFGSGCDEYVYRKIGSAGSN